MFAIDRLFDFATLTAALDELAAARPDLIEISEIGRSWEGRPIWLATVTNAATGPADTKPAVWVDANIHSVELTGSMAALHLLRVLVTGYGTDPEVTRVVDTRTFYVVPRVNPDGAELALAAEPVHLRSSVRPWPRPEAEPGLVPADIDGDGRLLDMRIVDPNGAWKVAEADPRLLVPRDPAERDGGPYYRVVPEGRLHEADPAQVRLGADPRGLDLNRNFPYGWRPHGDQRGAGAAPTSEPEVRALVDAITARPNIGCYVAHHTFSAAILRPYDDRPDDDFPTADLRRYRRLGSEGSARTGYRAVSVFHDFRYDPKDVISGSADTWAYDHLGLFGFTTEFWSPMRAAGLTDYHLVEWFDDHPVADEVALLAWSDRELGGAAFVDWYPFDHPQLGPVELGGWDVLGAWYNAPPALLEAEVAPHTRWELWLALVLPELRWRSVTVHAVADEIWTVEAVVENDGWLPTNVTDQAVIRKVVDPVVIELDVPDEALVEGRRQVEVGQLAGRERVTASTSWRGGQYDPSTDRGVARWIVRAPAGSRLTLTARHPRAGRVVHEVEVGA